MLWMIEQDPCFGCDFATGYSKVTHLSTVRYSTVTYQPYRDIQRDTEIYRDIQRYTMIYRDIAE